MSKLPDVGTTIFTVVSQRAQELGAINLAQGFPDYEVDPELVELIAQQLRAGRNQYAPMAGVPELRREIAAKLERSYGIDVDSDREVTITVGATEALFSAIAACVGAGDEVIVFDPAYDSYDPAVRIVGGRCVHIPLRPPSFRIPWADVAAAITPRTRMIVVNNPHNPACTVFARADLEALAKLVREHDLLVLADEVYEHVVLDGRAHHSVLSDPALRARSFAVFSFGKTFHATGWRLGYCVAPPGLTAEFRKVHQFNTFAVFTPVQYAIAEYLRLRPQRPAELPAFFARKRDHFCSQLAGSPFRWQPAPGTYFQLLDYSEIADEDDVSFADTLIRKAGVAAIPLSPFYSRAGGAPPGLRLLRFCIAKRDETLAAGARRLRSF
jgi:methionine aminotransferase